MIKNDEVQLRNPICVAWEPLDVLPPRKQTAYQLCKFSTATWCILFYSYFQNSVHHRSSLRYHVIFFWHHSALAFNCCTAQIWLAAGSTTVPPVSVWPTLWIHPDRLAPALHRTHMLIRRVTSQVWRAMSIIPSATDAAAVLSVVYSTDTEASNHLEGIQLLPNPSLMDGTANSSQGKH